ncbi:MAG: helix-turn-helix transcriptional regulator, partial [Clostridia bacterium]|nr:helix-turn-helix transcriptional regulator [Clostridia bacterium]
YYENDKRSPDIDMLRKMSKYFNVSIDYLINGKEFEKTE